MPENEELKIITEQGDLGLGCDEVSEEEKEKLKDING